MLILVTGSSCSGKTTTARMCADLPDLVVHDQDESGVPRDADAAWRQRNLETWVQRAIDAEVDGRDLVLTAQSPLGELLATPSSTRLDLAVCLVDVADRDRWIRLDRRDPGAWVDDEKRAFIGWARWHRGHALDLRDRPEIITASGWDEMQWQRWSSWNSTDSRWHVDTIDTTDQTSEQSAADLRTWIGAVRAARNAGTLPLARGWDMRPGS